MTSLAARYWARRPAPVVCTCRIPHPTHDGECGHCRRLIDPRRAEHDTDDISAALADAWDQLQDTDHGTH